MNTTETKINVRVDRKTKEEAKKTLQALGLDLSSGVKLFLRSVINTQSIPFEIRTKNGYTLNQEKELIDSIQELQKDTKAGTTRTYASAEEMLRDMDNWDEEGNYVRT